MNISGPFIRRPIGTSLLAGGVLIAGLVCYFLLGVAPLPNVEVPAIFVSANEPGASAATMAATVAGPLERHLGQIAGIDELFSRNNEGQTTVVMLFDVGRNVDDAARDVQAAINAAAPDLPSGLKTAPVYHKANPNNDSIVSLALTSKTLPLSQLYNYADSLLAQRIRQQPGVSDVEIYGGATPAVRVDLNLRALSSLGLSSDDVRNALVAANVTSPQGFLSDGQTMMAVAANDSLHNAADFADLVIGMRNGTPVRLSDVARVYDGQENQYQGAWFNGQRAIIIDVLKKADANIISTVDQVRDQLPLMKSWLPASVDLTMYSDRTGTIRASVDEVQITMLIALGLVILTMLLFLRRLAPTFIAGIAVPLSLAGAFGIMYIFGYTLDNLSLMALVISIGFVVDDAIVVIENVVRHIENGMRPFEAALLGAREIGFTVVSMTVSLIAVFIPLLFMGGVMGLFFREFGATLAAAVAVSGLVSLTVTPTLCARLLRQHEPGERQSALSRRVEAFHAGMLGVYRRVLDFSLRHRRLMALQPLLLVGLTVVLLVTVPKGYGTEEDTGLLRGSTRSGADVSYAVMAQRQQKMADLILKDPAVESVGSYLGGGWIRGNRGFMTITLKPLGDGRSETTLQVMNRLRDKAAKIPDIELYLRPISDFGGRGGGSSDTQYSYQLLGDDYAELALWIPRLVTELRKHSELKDVTSDLDAAGMQETLAVDRDAASRLGVTVGAIDSALSDAFGQRQVSLIYSDLNQYQVVLNAMPDLAQTPESLERIYVKSSSGKMVPISAVASLQPGLAPLSVTHEGQLPSINVGFNLAPKVSMNTATAIIDSTMRGLRMPGDIHGQYAGEFRNFRESQGDEGTLVIAAILAVYIVLGMLYESLIHPVTILSTLPSAGVGALLALQITNTELGLISMIAIVLLIGIVKKNAILVVDFALAAERERGLDSEAAVREASLVRFRPIMMTTMVAVFSAVPLAVGFGVGSEIRQPLGIAMVGGLLVSQALTLVSTPAIYLVFAGIARRWRERKRRKLIPAT